MDWYLYEPACAGCRAASSSQTCRHRCAYHAIGPRGAIRYDDCFQCLDCAGIDPDPSRCAPIMLYQRKGRRAEPGPLTGLNPPSDH